jgi:hypothetical protein
MMAHDFSNGETRCALGDVVHSAAGKLEIVAAWDK